MKKGSYWFSFLSEKEQKEFQENCDNSSHKFKEQMNWESDNFDFFISGAFNWNEIPQGVTYWYEISKRNVQ